MIYVERIRGNVLEKYIPGTNIRELYIPEGTEIVGTGLCSPEEDIEKYLSEKSIDILHHFFDYFMVKKIHIPASVKEIRPAAFKEIFNLETFEVDKRCSAAKVEDDVLLSKDGKTLICCPTQKQGNYIVPNGVEVIGENAFDMTELVNITIPDGVKIIENNAFNFSRNLTCVYVPCTVNEISRHGFSFCFNLTIKAPEGSYAIQYAKENGIKYEEI